MSMRRTRMPESHSPTESWNCEICRSYRLLSCATDCLQETSFILHSVLEEARKGNMKVDGVQPRSDSHAQILMHSKSLIADARRSVTELTWIAEVLDTYLSQTPPTGK